MDRRCFVIMPFSETTKDHTEEYWTEFFHEFVEPTVKNIGYNCVRSAAKPKNIIKGILQELTSADVVLAVLTDNNPNVWYELGTRHAVKRGTVMMIEKGQNIPFDISQYGVITYSDKIAKRTKFEEDLREFLSDLENGVEFDSPALDFFGMQQFRPCWVADRVQDTPLDLFSDALERVEGRLIVVGQNLFTLTQDRFGFKKKVFELLQRKPINIDLIVCENLKYIVDATAEFTSADFGAHLKHSISTFRQWEEDTKRPDFEGSITLSLSKKLGSLSLTFLDPGMDHGELLLTPIVQPHSTGRTCFWLTKKSHTSIFNHYYNIYESMFAKFT